MTVDLKEVNWQTRLVDKGGRPTPEFLEILQRLTDKADDHEDRIVALEP